MRSFGLLSASLLALAALPVQARDLSGKVALPQDIALPPGAELIVQARDRQGTTLAETRGTPDQPFSLTVPDEGALTISAALASGLTVALASEPLTFANDGTTTDLGTLALAPVPDYGLPATVACGARTYALAAGVDAARLRSGAVWRSFSPAVSASGAKYAAVDGSDGWVWLKGGDVSLRLNGADLAGCRMELPGDAAFVARGNEPGWSLRLDRAGAHLTRMGGAESTLATGAVTQSATGRTVKLGEGTALIEDRLCRDSATGLPYPYAVTLTMGSEKLQGCGGDPRDILAGPTLTATVLAGVLQMTNPVPNLTFSPDGRVSGSTGCNRFAGSYGLSGEGLRFGPLAGTRMACSVAQSATEAAMTAVLESITRFDATEDGQVLFYAGETAVLTTRAGR